MQCQNMEQWVIKFRGQKDNCNGKNTFQEFVSCLFLIYSFCLLLFQVQVLLYFLQLETIPTPDSKRQSILFSTEV